MSQPDDTNPDEVSNHKSNKVQLKHLLLDVDFFEKPKIRDITFSFGHIGTLIIVRWLTLMSRASNASVTRESLLNVAVECLDSDNKPLQARREVAEELLQRCIALDILTKNDLGVTNRRVEEDQEKCGLARVQSRDRQARIREKESRVSHALQTRTPVPVPVSVSVSNNNKNGQPSPLTEELTFPPSLDNDKGKTALQEWLDYKASKGQRYKSSKYLQKLLDEWKAQPVERFVEAVNWSIGSNYSGLFAKPVKQADKTGGTLQDALNEIANY